MKSEPDEERQRTAILPHLSEAQREEARAENTILRTLSDRLVAQAARYSVPIMHQKWEPTPDGWFLNLDVMAEVRDQIRKEKQMRLAYLSALTGVIGALIGLVAMIRGCVVT